MRTAIDIDEHTPGAPLTSMVDDAFFILQKCGRRALATGNVQCACAVVGAANAALGGDVARALEGKWKVGAVGVFFGDSVWGASKRMAPQCDAREKEGGYTAQKRSTHRTPPSSQSAALRLTQLLGAALDAGADVADDAAPAAAMFNDVDACAK